MLRADLKGKTGVLAAVCLSIVIVSASFLALSGVTSAATEIIVDNPSATFVGSWPISTYYAGFYGANYQWNAPGVGSDVATWWFTIPTAGQYDVYAWWAAAANKASNAPYSVYTGTNTYSAPKDQRANGGSWQLLGRYTFTAGSRYVRLTDNANAEVVADAIKVVEYVAPVTPVDYVSVPFSAFVPPVSNYSVAYDYSYGLYNREILILSYCYAPLQLPHGAVIKNATFCYYDQDAAYFIFYVMRHSQTATGLISESVAAVSSPGPVSTPYSRNSTATATPDRATVDNSKYSYSIMIYFPYSAASMANYRFYQAIVAYTPPP